MNDAMNFKTNVVKLPIYELDSKNVVKPNCAFHRSVDRLHSRCIEYPYTASQLILSKETRILDCGTVKSGLAWISWLETLECEVHSTDYDEPIEQFKNIKFKKADIRSLPYPDNYFDFVTAVSIIEHIGLESCQVIDLNQPKLDNKGDIKAIREIKRILKPHGQLVMTVPYGLNEGLILGGDARAYGRHSFPELISLLSQVRVDYFEYQSIYTQDLHDDFPDTSAVKISNRLRTKLSKIKERLLGTRTFHDNQINHINHNLFSLEEELAGPISWKRVDISEAKAKNERHIDGVVCCVLEKAMPIA